LAAQPITLGRHGDNRLVLSDIKASRFHGVIEQTPEGLLLRDLDSSNGTFLNKKPVKRSLLKSGDVIVIGSTTIRVSIPEPEVEEAELEEIVEEDPQVEIEVNLDPVTQLQRTAASLADAGVQEADISMLNARNQLVQPGPRGRAAKAGGGAGYRRHSSQSTAGLFPQPYVGHPHRAEERRLPDPHPSRRQYG